MLTPGSVTVTEAITRETHRPSGAVVKQLTSAPAIHTSIYCEVSYMDASSRWVICTKADNSHGPIEVWRADLQRNWLTPVADGVMPGIGMAVSPDQRFFFCLKDKGKARFALLKTDIATLEQEAFTFPGSPRPHSLGSVAPDGRTFIAGAMLGRDRPGIVRYDLKARSWRLIHEARDIFNSHAQIEPGHGTDVLIQHNRGGELDSQGRILKLDGELGSTLYLIDRNGSNVRGLPIGKPHTAPVQGHQCWIGSTGEILFTVWGSRAELIRQGNLLAVRPDNRKVRVVAKGRYFCHPNASKSGRFFVSDTQPEGLIVVGSIRTGQHRVLCESRSSFGSPQYTHPHPYFSPDCKWVIFTSDRTGIPQVFAASVPDGLLEKLEP